MKYLLSIFIICLFGNLSAQQISRSLDPSKKLVQFLVENWSTDQGLPTNSVLHIYQTVDGYIWISGYDGLIRFDGVKFDKFNQSNTPVFKSDVIRKMAQDKNGVLWITTQGSGLVSYNEGVFQRHGREDEIDNMSRALFIDQTNRIWSSSKEKGWFYYEDGEFVFLNHSSDLSLIEVRAIEQGNSGEIYFGTMGKGLFVYKAGNLNRAIFDGLLDNVWIYSIHQDNNNILWVGTNKGLLTIKNDKVEPYKLPVVTTVNSIIEDTFGNIWLGTNDGLFRINQRNNNIEWLTDRNGLDNNFIIDMLIDFEGTLWLTNYKGGLSRIKDSKFTNYNQQGGLNGKIVNAICELKPETYLVAFDNGELNLIDKGVILDYQNKFSLQGKRIRHIQKDLNNSIWISTYSGLLKIDKNGQQKWYNKSTGLPDNQIRLTYVDSKENLWIGTRNAGLVGMLRNGSQVVFNNNNGLSSNLVMSIDEDYLGNIIVGTSEGEDNLNIISDENGNFNISIIKGIDSDVIFNVLCDSSKYTWIATENGLYLYDNEKLKHFSVENGLVDNTIYDVLADNNGFLWMPFKTGIMKVKKKDVLKLLNEDNQTFSCIVYNKTDGMYSQESNPTSQSVLTSDGALLFATINGLSQIYPSNLLYNDYVPPVVIEKITVDNKKYRTNESMILYPNNKRITFDFTALSFYEPSKVQFKYKLEGFDDEWIDGGGIRNVSYTNLSHGYYTFIVIASNNDGVWNNKGASYTFQIKPYFYQTLWFYLVLIIVLITVFFLFIQMRIRQLKLWKIRLEKIVRDRTLEINVKNKALQKQKNEILAINQELLKQREEMMAQAELLEENKRELTSANGMKDKMFSIIAHDLKNPLGNLKGILDMVLKQAVEANDIKQKELFLLLSEQTQITFELLENLLNWSVSQRGLDKPITEYFLVDPIINEVIHLLRNQTNKKKITIVSNVPIDTSVYADINMVRTIFRNLINNAVKFTPIDGKITIEAVNKDEFIEFAIVDNGVGISAENQDKLFDQYNHYSTFGTNQEKGSGLGLVLCKDFITKSGGSIRFDSSVDSGSTFYFTLLESERN